MNETTNPWNRPTERMPMQEDTDENGWIAAWSPRAGFSLLQPRDLDPWDREDLTKIGVQWARIEDVVTLPNEAKH